MSAATPDATMASIDAACRRRGGAYSQYSCKVVSWDDVSRGMGTGGSLSAYGPNITDTYLKSKNGVKLFTVRPDNWNEKLGTVSASQVALITGNHKFGSSGLAPTTLRDVLKQAGTFGSYAGLDASKDLSHDVLDQQCSIRFQTTFLPVSAQLGGRETLEFATEAHNYQTRSDTDPRNLVLLSTTQGVAFQVDGAAGSKLFHHHVDAAGKVHRHWLEAERTAHQVGGAQTETLAEQADALARGKATACVIGPQCMGTRFNVLMTVQVPLKQQMPSPRAGVFGCAGFGGGCLFGGPAGQAAFGAAPKAAAPKAPAAFGAAMTGSIGTVPLSPTGIANAARVSYGSEHDVWSGLTGYAKTPVRHESEHITITIVLYNVVAGGVPSEADVAAAIDDLERLYAACAADRRAAIAFANAPVASPWAPATADPALAVTSTPNPFLPPLPRPAAVLGGSCFPRPNPPPLPIGSVPAKPFSDVPSDVLSHHLPRTYEGFMYVHELGMHLLNQPTATHAQLSEAFALFRLASEIHTQYAGVPSPSSLYNLACCCSRSATLTGQSQTSPTGPGILCRTAEECVDMACLWLRVAIASGYHDHAHLKADGDLHAVRAARAGKFATAVQMAEALATGV